MKQQDFNLGYIVSLEDYNVASLEDKRGLHETIVHHSNLIEGIDANWVETLVEGQQPKPCYEFYDHLAAFEYMIQNSHRQITDADILEVHRILMQHLRKDAGQYRTTDNFIACKGEFLHGNPKPKFIAPLLEEYVCATHVTESLSEVLQAHYMFETIHPFADGNGRTGRILLAWNAIQITRSIVAMHPNKRDAYYSELQKFRKSYLGSNPRVKCVKYEELSGDTKARLAREKESHMEFLREAFGPFTKK